MAFIVYTVIAAVLGCDLLVHGNIDTLTPYDKYGPCGHLSTYTIPCFNISVMCGKKLYVRLAAGYGTDELTDAFVIVDCFLDGTITATHSYSLNGNKVNPIFANLQDLGHGIIRWTIIQENVAYELQEHVITVFQEAGNQDLVIGSVICTEYAKHSDIVKCAIKATDLELSVSNEVRAFQRYFQQCPNMVEVPNAYL